MRRAAQALAARLAAASAKLAAPGTTMCGQAAPGRHGPGAAAAAVAAATVLAAGAQWGLAEAPHPAREQQPKAEQQQGQDGQQAECATCPDVSLEDQPVAISNSATAQVRQGFSGLGCRPAGQLLCVHAHAAFITNALIRLVLPMRVPRAAAAWCSLPRCLPPPACLCSKLGMIAAMCS